MVATILEYESLPARRATGAPREDRDAGLVQGLRGEEPDAADRLVTTYQSRAYRLALGITRNAQDAEEVVQDAFWSVLGKIARFRGDSTFGSWLYRIVANGACQKVRRRRWKQLDVPLDDVLPVLEGDGRHGAARADRSSSVDDVSHDIELRLALNAAIDELPAHHRVVLVLRDREGVSVAEIAQTLGLGIPNVKTRLHRARLFVRNRLTKSLAPVSSPDGSRS